MQSTNLSKKLITDISIYKKVLDNRIFKDFVFVDLMNKVIQGKVDYSHRFAIYTDTNALSIQILIPIFHTIYLGASNHNVIIENSQDLWLTETFQNNKYYVIPQSKDTFDYDSHNINVIQSVKEIV